MPDESIFDEDASAYDPLVQRRYWLILAILLCMDTAYLVFGAVQKIQALPDMILGIQYFNLLISTGVALLALIAVVLFFKKSSWGWIIAAAIISFWTVLFICASVFFLSKGHTGLGIKGLIFLAANAVLLYIIRMPIIRALYGIKNALARRTIVLGALAAAVDFTIGMVEPYWRL